MVYKVDKVGTMKKVWKDCDKELPTVGKVVQVLLSSGRIVVAKYLTEKLWVDRKDTVIDPIAYRA